jgi:SAM-dependent methyltransferase
MSKIVVPVDPAAADIRTVDDLIMLYESRLKDPSITSYSEMMLLTDTYQAQAFALATGLIGDLSACTGIVEIGCGCGCLLAHLRAHGFHGEYFGIDLVPGFIEKARAQFAEDASARFMVGNFLDMADDDLPRHDYYVAVSVFGFVPGDNYMREVVAKASRQAGKGVVITCNSSEHQTLPLKARSYPPAEVLSMCIEYGMSVDFKHRYIPVDDSHYAMIGALIGR